MAKLPGLRALLPALSRSIPRSLRLFASRHQMVALIGDEGAVFVRLDGAAAVDEVYIPVPDPDGEDRLRAMLDGHGRVPITIVIDVLEQHYREVSVPPANMLDRRRIIRRKVKQTYDDDHLTSYLKVGYADDPAGNRAGREHRYLLIGLQQSEELNNWIRMIERTGQPITGLRLLPMEAIGLMNRLSRSASAAPRQAETTPDGEDDGERAAPREEETVPWQMLVIRQRVSGFRQVVVNRGRLVFTRLTPNIEPDAESARAVDVIENEFRSTLAYIRRLSYADADRMEMVLVETEAVCQELDPRRLRVRSVRAIPLPEALQRLRPSQGRAGHPPRGAEADGLQDSADLVFALWIGQGESSPLTLQTPETRRSQLLAGAPRAALFGIVIAVLLGLAYSGWTYVDIRDRLAERAALMVEGERLQGRLDALEETLRTYSEVPPQQVQALAAVLQALAQATPPYATLLRTVGLALPEDMIVTKLELESVPADRSIGRRTAALLGPASATERRRRSRDGLDDAGGVSAARLGMTVRLLTDRVDSARALADRFQAVQRTLQGALPDFTVTVERTPFAVDSRDDLSGRVGLGVDGGEEPKIIEAVLAIEGPS